MQIKIKKYPGGKAAQLYMYGNVGIKMCTSSSVINIALQINY